MHLAIRLISSHNDISYIVIINWLKLSFVALSLCLSLNISFIDLWFIEWRDTGAYSGFCQGRARFFFISRNLWPAMKKEDFGKKTKIYFAKLRYYAPGAKANRGGGAAPPPLCSPLYTIHFCIHFMWIFFFQLFLFFWDYKRAICMMI